MSDKPLEQIAETGRPVPISNMTEEFLATFNALLPLGRKDYTRRFGERAYDTLVLTGGEIDRVTFLKDDVRYLVIKGKPRGLIVKAEMQTPEGTKVKFAWDTYGDGKVDYCREGEINGNLILPSAMTELAELPPAVRARSVPVVQNFFDSALRAGIDYLNQKAADTIIGHQPQA